MADVLEHLVEPERVLKNEKILKPGGRIFISCRISPTIQPLVIIGKKWEMQDWGFWIRPICISTPLIPKKIVGRCGIESRKLSREAIWRWFGFGLENR